MNIKVMLGNTEYTVTLSDSAVTDYRTAVTNYMTTSGSGSFDQERRRLHNKAVEPIVTELGTVMETLGINMREQWEFARRTLVDFLEPRQYRNSRSCIAQLELTGCLL